MIKREYSKSKNVIYVIDTNKREVSARIGCSIEDAQTMFFSLLSRFTKSRNMVAPISKNDFAPFVLPNCSYTGTAKCHPDDTFDIEFGKHLALERARHKYLHAVNAKLYDIFNWVDQFHDAFYSLCEKNYRREIESGTEIYSIEKEAGLY